MGDVQYIGGDSVHRGDTMMSTSGDVQYIRGYREYIGGRYHEYVGGCSGTLAFSIKGKTLL